MRTQKLIKRFEFAEDIRNTLVLGPNVRMNPVSNRLQLQANALGLYPLSAGLHARTGVAKPTSVKSWVGFQVDVVNVAVDGDIVTSVGYRLNSGTNQWVWNGTAWAISTILWNTEGEIATNIATFPASARMLGIVINLVTTDARYTPEVSLIKVLYEAQIDFQLDLIVRSLIPLLKEEIRGISETTLVVPGSTPASTVTLPAIATPYNILSIDAVYNHTDDPNHMADLLSSFNLGTRLITLLSPVASGKTLWVRFVYVPEVALTTGRTYTELAKVPAIVISDINLVDSQESGAADDAVVNKITGAGWKVLAPYMVDIEFVLRLTTDKAGDQHRLADEVKRFFRNNQIILSRGMDTPYRLWLIAEYQGEGVVSQEEVQAGRLRARIVRALFFDKPAAEVYMIQRLNITGTPDVTV